MLEARLQLVEYERARLSKYHLAAAGVPAAELRRRLGGFVDIVRGWSGGPSVARAGRRVGSVKVGGLRVDVEPRMASAEFATLVRYAWGHPAAQAPTTARVDRQGLDELLGRLLADEAAALLARGPARRYERRVERLPVVRGRPLFAQNFPWDPSAPTGLVCAHHLLTADNAHNRIVRAALERAPGLDVSSTTRRDLLRQRAEWRRVAEASEPGPSDVAQALQRTDRLTEHYALALRLSGALLAGMRPSGVFEEGQVSAGLTLDMAVLFEAFVARALGEWAPARGLTVREQTVDGHAFLDAGGSRYRSVRPDLVVSRDGVPVAVVDAKYKPYWASRSEAGTPARRVSTGDLYQLFFYAQRLQRQHGLDRQPAAVILSPLPAPDERGGWGVIADRYQQISWSAGAEGGIANLVLVPITEWLRDWDRTRRADLVAESLARTPLSGATDGSRGFAGLPEHATVGPIDS